MQFWREQVRASTMSMKPSQTWTSCRAPEGTTNPLFGDVLSR
jgi:hypothetical protein